MTVIRFIMVSICLLLFSAAAGASDLKVVEMAVTTKISKKKPVDSVHRISAGSVKWLYCFTRTLNSSEEETSIKHVWKKDGTVVRHSVIPIKMKRWRSNSRIPVDRATSPGKWTVEVQNDAGDVIKSVGFIVNH